MQDPKVTQITEGFASMAVGAAKLTGLSLPEESLGFTAKLVEPGVLRLMEDLETVSLNKTTKDFKKFENEKLMIASAHLLMAVSYIAEQTSVINSKEDIERIFNRSRTPISLEQSKALRRLYPWLTGSERDW